MALCNSWFIQRYRRDHPNQLSAPGEASNQWLTNAGVEWTSLFPLGWDHLYGAIYALELSWDHTELDFPWNQIFV